MRILVALLLVIAWPAQAHRMGLARLLIEQGETVELSLAMNPPAAKHRLRPLPPSSCVALSGWRPTLDRLHLAAQWRCSKPIEQLTIDQQGDYEGSLLVQLDRDGARIERVSRGGAPLDFRLPSQGQPANAFWGGFNHLLAGWDHLLLIALIGVSGRSLRSLLSATLAFTLGHAVSLTVVALGWVRLPGAPIEAAIALSLLMMAWLSLREEPRYEPTALISFGALHGLGLASGFASVGLDGWSLVEGVLLFNIGVELAQVGWLLAVVLIHRMTPAYNTRTLVAYAAGGFATYWMIQRTLELGS